MKLNIIIIIVVLFTITTKIYSAANTTAYDTARIYNAMIKARNGEDITIGVFGGSITAGSLASIPDKRWANLITDWWITTFPESNITLINAGIGGTGSDVGVHRLNDDLLVQNPDFIIVEFAVNDAGINSTYVQQMMEGITRQILSKNIAIMYLLLKMETFGTAQADHKIVGEYYEVPMVSYADLIDSAVVADGMELSDVFGDSNDKKEGVHPNDKGMQYIADFLIDEFNIIYNNLPDGNDLVEVADTLPAPLISDNYDKTFQYTNQTLTPLTNSGWTNRGEGWQADVVGSEISFKVDGNAISILYSKHNDDFRGKVETWIDDGTHEILDGYWEQTWGPATVFQLIQEGLIDGEHTLHVKIIEESSTVNECHFFEVMKVLKAGNILDIAPIVDVENQKKTLTNGEVSFDASNSYDPDTTGSLTYTWSLISSPANSTAAIDNPSPSIANFIPDKEGIYKIGLTISDGIYNSVEEIITIHTVASNTAPNANAGSDATIPPREYYELNGTNSSDNEGDVLLYNWRVISRPDIASMTLKDEDIAIAQFKSSNEGEFIFELTVSDSIAEGKDTVKIIVSENPVSVYYNQPENIDFSIYPNPSSNKINLFFQLEESASVNISIYSIDGKMVYQLLDDYFSKGKHELVRIIDHNLKLSGTYLIKFSSKNAVKTQKIVIQ